MIATTRAALVRGTESEDALGDTVVNDSTPVAGWADFPVSIIEKDSREFDQATLTWRTVKKLAARAVGTLPVVNGDLIRDNRDDALYVVDSVTRTARGLSGRSSVTMKLRRTAAP